jgi:CRP-like cAMP-binding protein
VITTDYLRTIAAWSHDLNESEIERARQGIIEKSYDKGECICPRGTRLDHWTGVVTGVVKLSTVSSSGKAVTYTGVPAGGWFGEGTVLKNEPRRYDIVALREARIAMMNRQTFLWLFENSVGFNRFLVGQMNERLGQFMALLEFDRLLDATARLARCVASMFNPILYPRTGTHLTIAQEEVGHLSGLSRQVANRSLKTLEAEGLLRLEYGGLTVLDIERLRSYGE